MKKLILALGLLVAGVTYASFPVQNNVTEQSKVVSVEKQSNVVEEQNVALADEVTANESSTESKMDNETIILVVLWFFLGFVAAHRWYAGRPVGWNILFILTAGGCGIWSIVDLIKILQGKW